LTVEELLDLLYGKKYSEPGLLQENGVPVSTQIQAIRNQEFVDMSEYNTLLWLLQNIEQWIENKAATSFALNVAISQQVQRGLLAFQYMSNYDRFTADVRTLFAVDKHQQM
jgi:hypothetical protein